ncbi:MAG: hypothetical protein ACM3NH_02895 [Candidatus Saccharibacteria bacterium]
MTIEKFFSWYLLQVPMKLVDSERILVVWIWRFFSVGFFILRVFSPWHKDITGYGRGFDLGVWLHAFGWNLISRLIGAILRLFLIVLGLILEALAIVLSMVLVAAWYGWPVIVGYLLITGISGL